jgi:large subunit ribosomal protein L30
MAKRKKKGATIRITLVRSPIGYSERQKRTLVALGLRKINQTVEKADSAVIRGMINRVSHLVSVEE